MAVAADFDVHVCLSLPFVQLDSGRYYRAGDLSVLLTIYVHTAAVVL